MAWTGAITNAGDRLLKQWEGGGMLHIESAAAGTGTVAEVALLAQTDLVSRKQTASILSKDETPEGLKIRLQITAPDTGYTLNQYGIWARLDDGPPTLLALFQRPDGIPIPSKSESPDFVYTFYALLVVSNKGNLEVHIDTSALASMEDLQKTAEQLLGQIDDIVATKQDELTGTAGQVVGYDDSGNAAAAEIGGVNLLRDTGSTKLAERVSTYGAAMTTSVTLDENSRGGALIHAVFQDSSERAGPYLKYGELAFENTEDLDTVTVSFWMRANMAVADMIVGFQEYGQINTSVGTEWKKYAFVQRRNVNPLNKNPHIVFLIKNAQSGTELWIQGIKMERGSVATDWSPAPEDLLPTAGGEIAGPLALSGPGIKYRSPTRTGTAIAFFPGDANGSGVAIGDGGRTIIGGGEAAQNLHAALGTDPKNESAEELHLASDTTVEIHTNCQTISGRKTFTFQKDGRISGIGDPVQDTDAVNKRSFDRSKPTVHTLVLSPGAWSDTDKTLPVPLRGVVADETAQLIQIAPAAASQQAYIDAGIRCTGQAANELTFTAETIPTASLTVYVVIWPLV